MEGNKEPAKVNKAGIYLLRFYVNGIETPVIVDDYFPIMKDWHHPTIAFGCCKSDEEEMWTSLVEKGWAKLHGTYARIESGHPSFAAMHLTGAPSARVGHKDVDDDWNSFWRKLQVSEKRNFIMMAAFHGSGDKKQ